MSNAIFGHPIYSDPTATFAPTFGAHGSWSASLPLTNLQDRRLAKVARSTSAAAANTRFSIDLKTARRIGVIAIPKHNLSTAAVINIYIGNDPTFAAYNYLAASVDVWPVVYPAGSLPVGDPRLTTGKYTAEEAALLGSIPFTHVPATPQTGRYVLIEVVDTTNVAGYVDLARLVLAGSYQPSINMSYGHRLALTSATIRTETDGGAAIYNDKPRRREQHFTIDQLPDDEALVNVYDMLLRIGTSGQLYFVFDAADTAHMHRRAMLCVLKELSALEFPYHRSYAIPFALIEEL